MNRRTLPAPDTAANMRLALDLLSEYAAYHRDRRNIASHFAGVPMIVLGVAALLARVQLPVAGSVLTLAWVVYAVTATYYLTRGNLALGVVVSAAVGLLVALAHGLASGSAAQWLGWGVGLFTCGWLIQFIGHWYEGRKPAFVDDLVGLLVGPMFVAAEAMFRCGWNKPWQAEIERRAGPTQLRDMAQQA